MQAITYPALGEVVPAAIADPEPTSGEIVVRVHVSGICHTDIDILHGHYGNSTFPIVPGHEFAGEIVATGDDVTEFAVGNRVVVDPNTFIVVRAGPAKRASLTCAKIWAPTV